MINLKTTLVLLAIIAMCYGGPVHKIYKKKHHHHGLRFLYYLTFLAIKLKIVYFLGTIFTIGLIAAKVVGIIKLTEYLKHKYPHQEEKIVYVNPHEHHDHDFGGYSGGYSGGFSGGFSGGYPSPSEYDSKTYPSYPPDFSVDHPPSDEYINNERYGAAPGPNQYIKGAKRSMEGNYGSGLYSQFLGIADRLRQLNLTDMALNEMGIKDEHCKKKFVCKAEFNAGRNIILRTGFNILKDVSYQRYKPNSTITSEEECDSLYQICKNRTD